MEIRDILQAKIKEVFQSASLEDEHFSNHIYAVIQDLKALGYTNAYYNLEQNDGEWILESDGQMYVGFAKVTINDEEFFLEISQYREGSAYSDYFYNDPELLDIKTHAEYYKPTVKASFDFKGVSVDVMSNGAGQVNGKSFPTVEDAIKSI